MGVRETVPNRLAVRFRRVRPDEVDQLMAIDAATWKRPLPKAEWERVLMDPGFVGAVAVLDGRIVGYMAYKVFDDGIRLYKIAVMPGFQGRGIGSAMLRRLKRTLRVTGRECIQLNVSRANFPARALYARHGFMNVAEQQDYYGPFEDAITMNFEVV